jgi:hypothetical protein
MRLAADLSPARRTSPTPSEGTTGEDVLHAEARSSVTTEAFFQLNCHLRGGVSRRRRCEIIN